jgi:hypothetical protein
MGREKTDSNQTHQPRFENAKSHARGKAAINNKAVTQIPS